jgi:hypothetical protein
VLILLASYQGVEFLDQQVLSIRLQTHVNWLLLIHNDGADPEVQALVEEHSRQDQRIEWLTEAVSTRRGACGNFAYLMREAQKRNCRYFALADQDDVWDSNKLERQLAALKEREVEVGACTPLLLHTDLRVVNAQLKTIATSFNGMHCLEPTPTLASLLAQNSVTGCSCLGNQALLKIALPVPESAAMHDWWLALCASSAGELLYLNEPTVCYRQHANNAIGARIGFRNRRVWDFFRTTVRRAKRSFQASFFQAQALSARLPEHSAAQVTLHAYINLLKVSRRQRYLLYRQLAIRRAGRLAQWQFFCQLMLHPNAPAN